MDEHRLARTNADKNDTDLEMLVSGALPRRRTAVLAVSGGLDSMALLHVAASIAHRRGRPLLVATYDHASGAHSERAASFVAKRALEYGLPVVVGRSERVERTEAAWRAARWDFLRSVARTTSGVIVTAHTRDDQVETILMRAMRDAGARGLAGLRAPSDVQRPFIDLRRAELAAFAKANALTWLEDPTNQSREYLRNRVRHELLPALRRVRPTIDSELIDIGERAAAWRRALAAVIESSVQFVAAAGSDGAATLEVRASDLDDWPREALTVAWPELASHVGLALDRRGTRRAVEFTTSAQVGRRIQLSGGWELTRSRTHFELRRIGSNVQGAGGAQPLVMPMTWDRWAFAVVGEPDSGDPWRMTLPRDHALWVRAWRPGDKLTIRRGEHLITRKVKYFLTDVGISGHIRSRWPVVLAGNEIVWIPGVRRSDAAAAQAFRERATGRGRRRRGAPVVTYACDYLNRRP